jgi:adhesin/invasin
VVFTATGVPGGVSAERSTVTAAPASISASNGASASTITVTVRDQFGNPVAGVEVTLSATGAGNTLVQPTAATSANGVTTGELSSTAVGSRVVSATAGGIGIAQTATVTVVPGAPLASNSSGSVPGGTSGAVTTMSIQLKDAFGNPVAGSHGSIGVAITGPNAGAAVNITDQGGGQYRATYTPILAGNDIVDVRVSAARIPGSPFTSAVVPGPVSPGASTATVTRDGFFIDAVVTARDAQGNPVGHGGDTVEVSLDGGAPVTAIDQGNGTYRASIVSLLFSVSVAITLNGGPIKDSPFCLGSCP